ncbi:unnamed protein product [Prunus brigantina]
MKSSHMWRKIYGEFCERLGSASMEMASASRWNFLNKELREREHFEQRLRYWENGALQTNASYRGLLGEGAAKAKRRSTLNTKCAIFLEQIAKNGALRIERDLKREGAHKARYEAYATERQQAQEQDMEDREMKIMAMDTSHMSLEIKSY